MMRIFFFYRNCMTEYFNHLILLIMLFFLYEIYD